MADEEWDEEELLLVTGRGSKAAGKKRRKADAESSDDDLDLDEEERAKLEGMNELEREMFLFERAERLQRHREKKQVLNQARNREPEQVEVRASSRRPRAPTGTDSAIGRIAAAHAQREAREKKKQQEEEERQEKQQRARSRKRQQQEQEEVEEEEELALPEGEEEVLGSADEEQEYQEEGSEGLEGLEAEEDEEEEEVLAATAQLGTRAEVYDEGTGYEEAEEAATLEEICSIQLKRSDLEAWHNEPFFDEDVRGCVLRIVPNLGQDAARNGKPSYMMVRIVDVVQRNSYAFGKAGSRTRKWLHLDDMTGHVFRHQMAQVSNGAIEKGDYDKARAKAQRAGGKFITKGDVQQALERLRHARNFKYDASLVKQMLQKKRASGKLVGSYAQVKARLSHELILAQQDGKPEEQIQKIKDDLERLEQQAKAREDEEQELLLAAIDADKQDGLTGKLKGSLGLAVVNMRNRDKNAFKALNAAPGSAMAKAAAASIDGSSTADVFSRRHTQSKVYWATSRGGAAAATAANDAKEQQLQRSASGAADVALLTGSLKKLDPAELIKVLDLNIDLDLLPPAEASALLPKRLLGLRWYESVEKRQANNAGRELLSLAEWKRSRFLPAQEGQ